MHIWTPSRARESYPPLHIHTPNRAPIPAHFFTTWLRLRVYREGFVRLPGQGQGQRRLAHAVLPQQRYPQRAVVAVVGRLCGRRLAEGLVVRHRCVSDRQRGRLVQARDPIAVLGHGLFPPQLVFDWQGRAPTAEGGCRGEKHTILGRNGGRKKKFQSPVQKLKLNEAARQGEQTRKRTALPLITAQKITSAEQPLTRLQWPRH